jgi:hypothetical protein
MRQADTSNYLRIFNSAKSYTESTKLVEFLLKHLRSGGDIKPGKNRFELLVSAFLIGSYDQWAALK